jgi:CRP-like cAMP-binding protein
VGRISSFEQHQPPKADAADYNPMSETEGLDGLGIWRDLTEVERSEIKSIMRIRRIARGEVLIEQGATSETFFIVNSGIV